MDQELADTKKALQEAEIRAYISPVTGLPNRIAFGIALYDRGRTARDLFDLADAEMYKHKAEQHFELGTEPRQS